MHVQRNTIYQVLAAQNLLCVHDEYRILSALCFQDVRFPFLFGSYLLSHNTKGSKQREETWKSLAQDAEITGIGTFMTSTSEIHWHSCWLFFSHLVMVVHEITVLTSLLLILSREAGGDARPWEERRRLYACSQSILHGADQTATELVSQETPMQK